MSPLQTRYAGIPGWGWLVIAVGVGIVGFVWWSRKKAATGGSTSGSGNNAPAVVDDTTGQLESIDAQIRDLQGSESQEIAQQTAATTPVTRRSVTPSKQVTLTQLAQSTGVSRSRLIQLNPQYNFPKGIIRPGHTIYLS
jgi:hypothetical protein